METKVNVKPAEKQTVEKDTNVFPDILTVAPSPHIRHKDTTLRLMNTVTLALLPALIFGIVLCFMTDIEYGIRSILLLVLSALSCVLFEWGFCRLTKRPVTVLDGSAVVTGVLLAMNVSPTLPPWQIVIGAFFAIVVVKELFGGIGKNIVNPALAARVFLFFSYPDSMSSFPALKHTVTLDGGAGATPLTALKGGLDASLEAVESGAQTSVDITSLTSGVDYLDMFFGFKNGCIGEISVCLLLLGGLFLLWRRVITWHIPVAYIATVALITFLFPLGGAGRLDFMLFHLLSGGLMLGAFFMATDYATSPVTARGRLLYGVVCGVITVLIRYFGAYPEGVSFSILIANLLVYYIDKATKPRRFGSRPYVKKEEKVS